MVEHLGPTLSVGAPAARPCSAKCADFAQRTHTTRSGACAGSGSALGGRAHCCGVRRMCTQAGNACAQWPWLGWTVQVPTLPPGPGAGCGAGYGSVMVLFIQGFEHGVLGQICAKPFCHKAMPVASNLPQGEDLSQSIVYALAFIQDMYA